MITKGQVRFEYTYRLSPEALLFIPLSDKLTIADGDLEDMFKKYKNDNIKSKISKD